MRRLAPLLLALAVSVLLAGSALRPSAAGAEPTRAAVFSGTGLWLDIWDAQRRQPDRVVAIAVQRGVPVIYVETSNWKSKVDVQDPAALQRLVQLAHQQGLRVVPWYLPGFAKVATDKRRIEAAMRIGGTDAVDGLGIDIEATIVQRAAVRARRAAQLAAWARATYPATPIAAIIPSPVSMYWPVFPYEELNATADAFLPMCYPSRRHSPERIYRDTTGCVNVLRERTGNPQASVHVITGVANALSRAQLDAAARATLDAGGSGFSLYDLATTRQGGWDALATFANG